MTAFNVKFNNLTGSVWTLVISATLPGGGGLDSVAFAQVRTAPSGKGTIPFDDQLCVCLAAVSGSGGSRVYETTLAHAVTPGTAWQVVMNGGVQQFAPDGNARFPNEIDVRNASNALANIGLGVAMTGAVFQPDVPVNTFVPFPLPLSYQAMLSSAQVAPGQVMSTSFDTSLISMIVVTSPAVLTLSPATPNATVSASMPGVSLELTVTYP